MLAESPEYGGASERTTMAPKWLERLENRRLIALVAGALVIIGLLLTVVSYADLKGTLEYGGDEGCELVKADLVLQGMTPMKDFWSDQPPLHTYIIAFLFQTLGRDVLYARLLSVVFAAILLLSLFTLARQRSGELTGVIAAAIIVVTPSFSMLAVSVMSEMPAIAGCLLAMAVLSTARMRGDAKLSIAAGVLIGILAHLKLTVGLFLPAFALAEALENRTRLGLARLTRIYVACALAFAATYIGLAYAAFDIRADQLLGPHFNYTTMTEFDRSTGSVTLVRTLFTDFLYDRFMVVAVVISLAVALGLRLRSARLPVLMMASVFAIHAVHKPYWIYYYIHLLIPAAWLIAEAVVALARTACGLGADSDRYRRGLRFSFVVLAFCALAGATLIDGDEKFERTGRVLTRAKAASADHILKEVMKNATDPSDLVFTLPSIYMFQANRRPPPELGVVSFKRMASDLRPDGLAQTIVDTGVKVFACPESVLTYPRFWTIISDNFEQVGRDADMVVFRRNAWKPGSKQENNPIASIENRRE